MKERTKDALKILGGAFVGYWVGVVAMSRYQKKDSGASTGEDAQDQIEATEDDLDDLAEDLEEYNP